MKEEPAFLLELQKLVSRRTASILYKPLKGEIDYRNESFPLAIHTDSLILPNNKDSDPFEWAIQCLAKFKNAKPYILIPGARFDLSGTRHGRGAGWYDRFLSKVPSGWLRIGIIDKSKISRSKLLRQEWDEPVDWIMAHDGHAWSAYRAQAF